jgi:hypothetical protein
MKNIFFISIFIFFACGRPSSTEIEQQELKERERLETITEQFEDIEGVYSGEIVLLEDNSIYLVELNIKTVQKKDPDTNLPLRPDIMGSISFFESSEGEVFKLITYGVSEGSYDQVSTKLSLELANNLSLHGTLSENVFLGELFGTIKGLVGKLKLVRE